MKELALKYGCNPNQKPSRIYICLLYTSSDKFSLSHEDNTFTIQLSTLTYNNVEQISYAYSING